MADPLQTPQPPETHLPRPRTSHLRRTGSRKVPVWQTSGGRALWMTVALLFLGLVALTLWLFIRTRAPLGVTQDREGKHWLQGQSATVDTAQPILHGQEDISPRALTPGFSPVPEPAPEGGNGLPMTSEGMASQGREGLGLACDGDTVQTVQDTVQEENASNAPKESESEGNIVYYRHKNDRMEIALSFDDGPHPRYTPEILSILKEYGVTATFFMVGENVIYYPDTAEAVLAAGHEIGNHTYTHKRLRGLSDAEIRREILRGEEAIATLGEYRPHLLRPPEGSMNRTIQRMSGELDYRLILWDIDTRDWAHTAPEVICKQILENIQAGDIILMHDFISKNSPTPAALRLVIPALLDRGYHFVTVSRLIDGE